MHFGRKELKRKFSHCILERTISTEEQMREQWQQTGQHSKSLTTMGFSHFFPCSQTSFPITLKLKAAATERVKTKEDREFTYVSSEKP